jgi:hypothetical protein
MGKIAMAKQKKRVASRKTKSKTKKVAKKSAKRAIGRKSRRLPKKISPKASQKKKPPSRGRPKTAKMVPVVEGEIIDVVDEPLPGMVRVTEIETTRVTIPDANDDGEN